MTTTTTTVDLIADNGGGLTLQVQQGDGRYTHSYDSPAQCANDLRVLASGSDVREWDGNEIEAIGWMERDGEIERNGGYTWYDGSAQDVIDALESERLSERLGGAEQRMADTLAAEG